MKYMIRVAYDGTEYSGFQRQAGAVPTIQLQLEQAAAQLFGRSTVMTGAGRTDSGVHARGQVVDFRAETGIPTERLPCAFNSRLPRDIVVCAAAQAPEQCCARRSAVYKIYRYRIWRARVPCPLEQRYAWHRPGLDETDLKDCARLLTGTNDYRAFSRTGSSARTTVRTVRRIEPRGCGDMVTIDIEADGFLYAMARLLVGTMVEAAAGRLSLDAVQEALSRGTRGTVGATAPAHGLCLERVVYRGEWARVLDT